MPSFPLSHRERVEVREGIADWLVKNHCHRPADLIFYMYANSSIARQANMKYVVIVEKGETGYGAYVPDLPGCVAAAESRDEVLHLIKEAIEFHIEGLQTAGESVPAPSSVREVVEVNAA